MRIAVVGAGVSGLTAARLLSRRHDVRLFEAADEAGGHANTVACRAWGETWTVDTGFMVFNRRTYPNFCRMLDELGVASQPSDMSFSVSCAATGLEYQGSSLNGLFAQRGNLVRGRFYRMLADILRFNRDAFAWLRNPHDAQTVGEFLRRGGYGSAFREHYLVPMTAAIWSADPAAIGAFPARFLLEFLANHGLLQLRRRPQWLTIRGGSRRYVDAILRELAGRVRRGAEIASVQRSEDGARLTLRDGAAEEFDAVVLAVHADDARALLVDADPLEQRLLAAFPYQHNEAVLHRDARLLPRRRAAWASWNYFLADERNRESGSPRATVTYDLSRLQRLDTPEPLLVTLNRTAAIDPDAILARFSYRHPAYGLDAIAAQRQWDVLNGRRRTYFCGAYWRYGFHEDGVVSGIRVARLLGIDEVLCTVASTAGTCGTAACSP